MLVYIGGEPLFVTLRNK